MLNVLSLISFANAVFFLFIAVYSISIDRKSKINRSSAIECLLLGVWAFAYTFFYVAPDKSTAWFWYKIGSIGWTGFMGVLIWFFLELSRHQVRIPKLVQHLLIWMIPVMLFIMNMLGTTTSGAIDLVQSTSGMGWTYHNRIDNILYWFYVGYIFIGVGVCAYILTLWTKTIASQHFKRIISAFLLVDGVLIFIGFLSDLVIPLFTDFFPPMTNIFLMVFCFSYWIIIFKLDVFRKNSLEASEFILNIISDALIVLNKKGIIQSCNKATLELLHYEIDEMVGQELIHFFNRDRFDQAQVDKLFQNKQLTNQEAELLTKEGQMVKTIYSATIAENDAYGFMGIIVSFHDVTAQKELEKKLFTLAHYDALTELPNRRYFLDMLYSFEELYLKGNPDFAILFIDLDGFKEINDAMGHDVGDQLLVAIGARLNACVEDADIVARIGGDEFVILQGNVQNERDIHKRQAIILNQFKRPIQIENHKCSVGLSIGYSRYSEMKNIPDMMREADRRMYAEKAKHTFQQDHH